MSLEGISQAVKMDRIEALRHILEHQQSRLVSYEEAKDIGEGLIMFFETLGEEPLFEAGLAEDDSLGAEHGQLL